MNNSRKLLKYSIFNFPKTNIKNLQQLAEFVSKNPMVYATSKFDVGKIPSPLLLPLKHDAVFKKQRQVKNQSTYNI